MQKRKAPPEAFDGSVQLLSKKTFPDTSKGKDWLVFGHVNWMTAVSLVHRGVPWLDTACTEPPGSCIRPSALITSCVARMIARLFPLVCQMRKGIPWP